MERLNMTNGNEEETEKASRVRSKRFPVIAAAAVPAMAALLCAAGWVVNNSAANPFRSHDEGEPESVQNDAMETASSALAGIAAGAVQPPGEAEYAAPHKITEPVRRYPAARCRCSATIRRQNLMHGKFLTAIPAHGSLWRV